MLGLGVSLAKEDYAGGWLPSDESSLEAWYQNKVGITLKPGTENVSEWADQSGNGHHMVQTDTGEQPAYNLLNGALTFDPTSDTQNLEFAGGASSSNITLDAEFVIGIKMDPTALSTVILGSNSLPNEMVKLQTGSILRLKNDSAGNKDFTLDSGDTRDDAYWVVARDGSNNTTIYKDGVRNPSSSISIAGTFDINAIGVRKIDLNPYAGTVKEVVIFRGVYDTDLIANLNDRLSGL